MQKFMNKILIMMTVLVVLSPAFPGVDTVTPGRAGDYFIVLKKELDPQLKKTDMNDIIYSFYLDTTYVRLDGSSTMTAPWIFGPFSLTIDTLYGVSAADGESPGADADDMTILAGSGGDGGLFQAGGNGGDLAVKAGPGGTGSGGAGSGDGGDLILGAGSGDSDGIIRTTSRAIIPWVDSTATFQVIRIDDSGSTTDPEYYELPNPPTAGPISQELIMVGSVPADPGGLGEITTMSWETYYAPQWTLGISPYNNQIEPNSTVAVTTIGNTLQTSTVFDFGAGLAEVDSLVINPSYNDNLHPDHALTVAGESSFSDTLTLGGISILDSSPADGEVLTMTGTGVASFQAAAGGGISIGDAVGSSTAYSMLAVDGSNNLIDVDGIYPYQPSSNSLVISNKTGITGTYNTVFGMNAGNNNMGAGNITIGPGSGQNLASGATYNVLIGGFRQGNGMSTGDQNILIGFQAGYVNNSTNNVMIGKFAGLNYTGSDAVFIGSAAGQNTTNGIRNFFLGTQAGFTNTTGQESVYVGYYAGNLGNGWYQFGMGSQTLRYCTGEKNTAIGAKAGTGASGNADFDDNVLVGYRAGNQLQDNADGSVMIGDNAGYNTTTGAELILIGRDIDASSASASNEMNIGNVVRGTVDTGSGEVGEVYLGAEYPSGNYTKFDDNGDQTFTGTAGFYPRLVSQAAEPASGTGSTQVDQGEIIIWEDTDDSNKIYLIYNNGGTITKVQMP